MLYRALLLCALAALSRDAYAAQCSYDGEHSFLSRVVAVDAPGGAPAQPAGAEAAAAVASPLELHEKEVVLTFGQGPHPNYTTYILDILDRYCVKATFFFSGSAAAAHPAAVRDATRRGHTIAAGPWSGSASFAAMPVEGAGAAIEKSFAAVAKAGGEPVAPFFGAGSATLSPAALDYLKARGVTVWSARIPSGDKAGLTATQVANGTLAKVREAGKGIIQFHDSSKVTVDALDSILTGLKLSGFKVVQVVPVANFTPKDGYLSETQNANPLDVRSQRASSMLLDVAKRNVEASERRREQRRVARLRREEPRRRHAHASEHPRRRVTHADAD